MNVMENEEEDTNSGNYRYDVFVNFSREDTLHFVTSLCAALREKGLIIYCEDEALIMEDPWPSICNAIEESRILIVVLSENYAYSWLCLLELEKIVKCSKKNQLVLPIFYDVDTQDVKYCLNTYYEPMKTHEYRFEREEVQEWRNALREVSSFDGWHFQSKKQAEEEFLNSIIKVAVDLKNHSIFKYDVFLSHRLEDTRHSFTGFLGNVLQKQGFKTFMDNNKDDNQISHFHINAIQQSKFSIIVFSENYAYSTSCLDALVKILECKKSKKQHVFPIFYKVQPSDVRYQTSHFNEAMIAHEMGNDSHKVHKWRSALFEVASLKGWHFNIGYEYKTIERIVALVNKLLPRYDVFLSFRGRDTRYAFTGYLYYALCKKGFKTFMDDEVMEGGEQISGALTNAIEHSSVSIVVFSENFAYSSWCLDELVHILKCRTMKTHYLVLPIYYKVKPSDIWNQECSYGRAMNAHKNRLGYGDDKVLKWKSALSEVKSLDVLHFSDGFEYEFIENIVENISETLGRKS